MKNHFIRIFVALSGAWAFPLAYHLFDYLLSPEDPNFALFLAGSLGGSAVMLMYDRFRKNLSTNFNS